MLLQQGTEFLQHRWWRIINLLQKRRGLATVVGTVFFVIVAASIITYVTYSMDLIENYSESIGIKQTLDYERQTEEFEVVKVGTVNNKFNFTLQNTGNIPVKITRLWVKNTTDSTWPSSKFDINKAVTPGAIVTNIGQNIALTALDTAGYDMKLVTERGTVKKFSVNSVGNKPLYMQLDASPTIIPQAFTTTLVYEVVNNQTNDAVLLNLKPLMAVDTSGGTATVQKKDGPSPASIDFLEKGDTALFKWVYEIDGASGDSVQFTSSLQNGYPGNTASVTASISSVPLADTSATSVESQGITCCKTKDEILVFHDETADTPNGERQMDNRGADSNGVFLPIDSSTTFEKFITNNDTGTVTIQSGHWDLLPAYHSNPFPESLMPPSSNNYVIYHFETGSSPEDNSGKDNLDLTLGFNNCTNPTFSATGGPHGTGAYQFSAGDCMRTAEDNSNDIGGSPDSTSSWFKLDGGAGNGIRYILNAHKDNNDEKYQIYVDNDNKFNIRWDTDNSPQTTTTCTSNTVLSANQWYHFVWVRIAAHDCALYINGTSYAITKNLGSGGGGIGIDEWIVGAKDDSGTEAFEGWIDDLIHFNDRQRTLSESNDMYNTNYGNNAHKIKYELERVNQPATNVFQTIHANQNLFLPFKDGKWQNSAPFTEFNYSFIKPLPVVVFNPQQRLLATMTYISGLGLDLRVDDSNIFEGKSSYLQTPDIDRPFASFFTYDNNGDMTFSIKNLGPHGFWFSQAQTRAIFQSLDGINAWAGILIGGNGTGGGNEISSDADSIYIPVGSIINLIFEVPDKRPIGKGPDPTQIVPEGIHRLHLNIVGYDAKGEILFKSFEIGLVRVT